MTAPSSALAITFEGHRVTTRLWKGRPAWVAREVGEAMGYSDGSRLVDKITGDWSRPVEGEDDEAEMLAGTDFDLLSGTELAAFRALLSDSPESGESTNPQRGARFLTILYEPGLHMVSLKTRKPQGRKLRRMLADVVLPQLVRTGTAVLPGAPTPTRPSGRALSADARDATIARMIGEGFSDAAIARSLGCARKTVREARREIRLEVREAVEPTDVRAQLAELLAKFEALTSQPVAFMRGTIGDGVTILGDAAKVEISGPVERLARRLAVCDPTFSYESHRSQIHGELRAFVAPELRGSLAMMPVASVGRVRAWLHNRERLVAKRERALATKAAAGAQPPLDLH